MNLIFVVVQNIKPNFGLSEVWEIPLRDKQLPSSQYSCTSTFDVVIFKPLCHTAVGESYRLSLGKVNPYMIPVIVRSCFFATSGEIYVAIRSV
jgi:hypothetical protein